MVSESEISFQAHGVHTAYEEMASALEKRDDVELIRGKFGEKIECDIIHLHTIGNRVWGKLFQKGPKKVVSVHIVPASFIGSLVGAKYWSFAAKWYMKWFYNKADKLLAVSGMVAKTLHDDLDVPAEKIETFYNTINMEKYKYTTSERKAARDKLGLGANQKMVLGNGQVQPRKRLDVFIQMANDLPEVKFIWIGGITFKKLGADYANMQRLMSNLPKNMTITGVVDHSVVRDYYIAADVFCLPAEQENHPMCVLEAAGANLPIILRDIHEYDDTFKHDAIRCVDGQFTDAVRRLISDKNFYDKQVAATKKIAERFDSNNAAKRLVQIYKDLL